MSQNKVTRETIANKISQEFGIAYATAYKKIDIILNIWSRKILESDLNVASIGAFKIKYKSSRVGRNPKTKEEFEIKPRKTVSFKKSKKLNL